MKSWLSLLGLYRYDNTIFDELVVPAEVVKSDLIQNLLVETAELEVIYPDPEIMRQIIGSWSRARLNVWKRIALVLYKNYDPFINITRDETRTINTEGDNISQVSAWDSSSFTNREKNTGGSTVTETLHVEGDSAITDAQDVARKEVELRSRYELDDYIINDFKNRFCLLVY